MSTFGMLRVAIPLSAALILALGCSSSPSHVPAATQNAAPDTVRNLLPQPTEVTTGTGRYVVADHLRIRANVPNVRHVERALERLVFRWQVQTGAHAEIVQAPAPADLIVDCANVGAAIPSLEDDESYTLDVTSGGVHIAVASPVGIVRAAETLVQLVAADHGQLALPVVGIRDRPRFPWRGLLIDSSRHFLPAPAVERILEAMAVVKMNVLHFHLTDEPGFRAQSFQFPKLQGMGGNGEYYSQEELQQLIDFAAERGIRVVPEFDMPGHVSSWLAGYPELASLPGPYQVATSFGWRDPAFDPTREDVYAFIASFIDEMAPLFPDPYWHIGGDEVGDQDWDGAPSIVAYKNAHGIQSNRDLQGLFSERVRQLLAGHGKTMMGWEDVLNPNVSGDVVVQSWRSASSLATAARQGHRGILSAGYYLDLMMTAEAVYSVEPVDRELDATSAARVLGGEVCMWGELVDASNIDSRLWPISAAAAERLWSAATVTDVPDLYRRLWLLSAELEQVGATHVVGPRAILASIAGPLADSLGSVVETLAPLPLATRLASHPYTTTTPFNRVVDAAIADPRAPRDLAAVVEQLAQSQSRPDGSARVRAVLEGWKRASDRLQQQTTGQDPRLLEVAPLVANLHDLATVGLTALDVLDSGVAPPPEWRGAQEAVVARADQAAAELHSLVPPIVRRLLDIAAEPR